MAGQKKKHVAICGGGLVGALYACFLSKRGFKVDLYEMRPDIRNSEVVKGRSINLTLTHRGIEALKSIGIEDIVVEKCIPLYDRMIHYKSGTRRSVPYGLTQEHCALSITRKLINGILLTCAEKESNVTIHYSHKVVSCDLEMGEIVFQNEKGHTVTTRVDLIVGADGAYSTIRKQMMRSCRVNYQQEYSQLGYMELYFPPGPDNEFPMEKNYFHVWPRGEILVAAFPNLDKSISGALVMPFEIYDKINTKEDVITFFNEMFPDIVPIIDKEFLTESFLARKGQPFFSIKCSPYHYKDKAVLIGDAAHTMLPFYGQGMNAGFEDCLILDEMMEKFDNDLELAFAEFSKTRCVDANVICDLALRNYTEIQSKSYFLRGKMNQFLTWMFPRTWIPLYTMVVFTRMRYHHCVERAIRQDKILSGIASVSVLCVGIIAYGIYSGKLNIGSSVTNYITHTARRPDMIEEKI